MKIKGELTFAFLLVDTHQQSNLTRYGSSTPLSFRNKTSSAAGVR